MRPELPVENLAVYNACKSAVRGLTRSLAKDMGGFGIRVNAILPGAILTEKQRTLWYPDQAAIDVMINLQCLKRELCGQDIAHMAMFLASMRRPVVPLRTSSWMAASSDDRLGKTARHHRRIRSLMARIA